MSESDVETFADDLPLHLPPETLELRIRTLVRRYVERRSPQIAQAVARLSRALVLHPALRDQPEQLRGYCRLSWHWRLLAAQHPIGATN
jgi:hypothetical protein